MNFIHKYFGFRLKLLKLFLISFTVFALGSCSLPTNWIFVNQNQVETLLQSPETIDYEGKTYELVAYQSIAPRGRGLAPHVTFHLSEKIDSDNNLKRSLKIINLWIINKPFEFYFETTNYRYSNENDGTYSLDTPSYYHPVFGPDSVHTYDVLLIEFVSNNKTYFIKTII